jgi:hypothetical protein
VANSHLLLSTEGPLTRRQGDARGGCPQGKAQRGGVTKYQPERKQPGILAARAGYSIRWSQIAKKQMIRYGVRTLNSRQRLCQ